MGLGSEGNIIRSTLVSKPSHPAKWTDPEKYPPKEDGFYIVIAHDHGCGQMYTTVTSYFDGVWEIEKDNDKCDAYNVDWVIVRSYVHIPQLTPWYNDEDE